MLYKGEKNHSIETDSERTVMAELPDKNIQTAIMSMFKMLFNLKEVVNVMRKKNGRFFKKNQLGVLEIKNKIADMMSLGRVDMGLLCRTKDCSRPNSVPRPHSAQDFPMYTPCMIPGTVNMMDFAPVTMLYYIA